MPKRLVAAAAALSLSITAPALAADPLRVGTAAQSFMFVPLDVGLANGEYAKLGLDIRKLDFSGAGKLNGGLVAGAVDVGLTGGTDFSFQVKGEQTKTVAGIITSAADFGLSVGNDIHSVADLKGKRIGVSQRGTLTYWMAEEFSRSQGWGPDGVIPTAIGGENSSLAAAILTGQVAAVMFHIEVGMTLEAQHRGRVLLNADRFIPGFMANSITATDKLISERPDVLRRFLQGWFDTVTYMMDHEDATVAAGAKANGLDPELLRQVWRQEKGIWSRDGRISPAQLDQIATAITEIGLVPSKPDLTAYYDPRFLPADPRRAALR